MFRIAKDLGRTVYELGEIISYEEVMEWSVYYDKVEANRVAKQDLYLARIAQMLCADGKLKLDDFIIKFKDKEEENKDLIKLDGQAMAQIFKGIFGIKD